MTIRVALDVTATIGTRTGIGNAVHHIYQELTNSKKLDLIPYTVSYKGKSFSKELPSNNVFFNIPAKILIEVWKHADFPKFDSKLNNPSIIHSTNYLAPPTKALSLITIHDMTFLRYPDMVSSATRSLVPIIENRIRNGSYIHVPTQAIKNDVLEFFGNKAPEESKIFVVPLALPDLEEKKPSETIKNFISDTPFILSIGALEPRKNHARLIEAFGLVADQYRDLKLLLAGPDGPARPQIDLTLSKLRKDIRDRVVITGKVSSGDRTYLLKNAQLVAYPSIYEGFGLPLLEAMNTHTPIVTTKEGSLEEVAQDCALYVDAFDASSIAKGLNEVLSSSALRDKLVESGKIRAKDFSWDKTAQELIKVYEKIDQTSRTN